MGLIDWPRRAACRGADPEIFFPIGDIDAGSRTYDLAWRAARTYCAHCPVLADCDERARRTRSQGLWAGTWRAWGAAPVPLIPAAGDLARRAS